MLAIGSRWTLPHASLIVGLTILVLMIVPEASMIWDGAWHQTKEKQESFFGLPHPWSWPHFGLVGGIPVYACLLALLVRQTRQMRRGHSRLATVSFLGRRGPVGAIVGLLSLGLIVLGAAIDTGSHVLLGDERLITFFSPFHFVLLAGIVALRVAMLLLMYNLATGPALVGRWQRRLARLGLLLAIAWMADMLTRVIEFAPHRWSADTNSAMIALTTGVAIGASIRLCPWRFPTFSVLLPGVLLRAAVADILVELGYRGVPGASAPLLLAALGTDLWLLLVGRRQLAAALLAGLLFGLVWTLPGYLYFLPYSWVPGSSLIEASLKTPPLALLGTAAGLALARAVELGVSRSAAAEDSLSLLVRDLAGAFCPRISWRRRAPALAGPTC